MTGVNIQREDTLCEVLVFVTLATCTCVFIVRFPFLIRRLLDTTYHICFCRLIHSSNRCWVNRLPSHRGLPNVSLPSDAVWLYNRCLVYSNI